MNLKPCPFCGGEAEVEREGNGRVCCVVRCTNCGCSLQSNENGYGDSWNSRHQGVSSVNGSAKGWTEEKPRVPGWYWALHSDGYSEMILVYHQGGEWYVRSGESVIPLDNVKAKWSGPYTLPAF